MLLEELGSRRILKTGSGANATDHGFTSGGPGEVSRHLQTQLGVIGRIRIANRELLENNHFFSGFNHGIHPQL